MTKITHSETIACSDKQMFELVSDIESYPLFLPWCSKANIINNNNNQVKARLTLQKGVFSYDFITQNTMTPYNKIKINLISGPFSHLEGVWNFYSIKKNTCEANLNLEFEISNPVLRFAIGSIFETAMNKLTQSFCQRAHDIYLRDNNDKKK